MNELTRVGDAPGHVTDGVFLPGGKQIALLTYVLGRRLTSGRGRPRPVATATAPRPRR